MLMNKRTDKQARKVSLPAWICAAVLLAAITALEVYSQENLIAVKGGRILTMAGKTYEDGVLLVRNGRILNVGKNLKIPRGAQIIEATGKYIMPGIIDSMTQFGTQPFAPNVSEPVSPENKIIDAYRPFGEAMRGPGGVQPDEEILCGGITSIYIAPGSGQLISGQGAVVKTDGRNFDSMVLKEPASIDMTLDYVPIGGGGSSRLPSRLSSLALMRKTLGEARDYQKKHLDPDAKSKVIKEKPRGTDRDLGKEVLTRLFDGDITARIEADSVVDIMNALRMAEEFEFSLVIDSGIGAYKVRELLAEKKIPVVLGPLSHPFEFVSDDNLGEIRTLEDDRSAALLTEAGVKVAISSRSTLKGGSGKATQGRWLLLEAALASGFGLSEEEALKTVTINAAEILGVADRIGSLEPGKDADFVVLSGHPLKVETHIEQVFIDGRLSYSRGKKEEF